jgi:hypothetical protein
MAFAVFGGESGRTGPGAPFAATENLCPGLELFHDASSEATGPAGSANGEIALALTGFDGSYVSLAATPDAGTLAALGPGRLLRIEMLAKASRPIVCYLRLNLEFEEDSLILHETIMVETGLRRVDFDLAAATEPYADDTRAWVDIIFSDPAGRILTISDLRLKVVIRGWPEQ